MLAHCFNSHFLITYKFGHLFTYLFHVFPLLVLLSHVFCPISTGLSFHSYRKEQEVPDVFWLQSICKLYELNIPFPGL